MSPAHKEITDAADAEPDPGGSSGDNETDDDRIQTSWLINSMINAMPICARRKPITPKKLSNAYKENEIINDWDRQHLRAGGGPSAFPIDELKTYGHLFGFGGEARGYARPEGQIPSRRKRVQIRHIETIDVSLRLLEIYRQDEVPTFDVEPASWVPFLECALAAIEGRPVNPIRGKGQDRVAGDAADLPSAELPAAFPDLPPTETSAFQSEGAVLPASQIVPTTVGEAERAGPTPAYKVLGLSVLVLLLIGLGFVAYHMHEHTAQKVLVSESKPEAVSPQKDGVIAAIIDLKVLIGPNVGTVQSTVPSILPFKIDPRLDEAARLKAAGRIDDADRLYRSVVADSAQRRVATEQNEADAHRALGASAYLRHDYDGSIGEYNDAISLNKTAADFHGLGAAYQAKRDFGQALANYSKAIDLGNERLAAPYNNRGTVYMAQQPPDRDHAIDDFSAAIGIDPNFEDAFNNRGNAFASKGDFESAKKNYESAIALDPKDAGPYNGLGNLYFQRADIDHALENYDRALQCDPSYLSALINRGFARYVRQQFESAKDDLRAAVDIIAKMPDFDKKIAARAYRGLGATYLVTLDSDNAVANLKQAIRLDPATPGTYDVLGLLYGTTGMLNDAFGNFDQAIRLDPKLFLSYWARGTIYALTGDMKRAFQDFDEVVKLTPNEPFGYLTRGLVEVGLGKRLESLEDLERAEQLSHDAWLAPFAKTSEFILKEEYDHALEAIQPLFSKPTSNNLFALRYGYSIRGDIHIRKQDYDGAVDDLNEALKLAPKNAGLYVKRAMAYARMTKPDLDKAISDYKTAIDLQPPAQALAFANFELGRIFAIRQDFDRALEYFDSSIALGISPFNLQSHYSRADIFESRGAPDKAISEYREIVKVAPETPDDYSQRARAFRALGDFKDSLADYTTQIDQNKRDSRAYDNRGDTHYASQEFGLAIDDYTSAIAIDPDFVFAYFDRGKAQEALHNYEPAIEDYSRAAKLGRAASRAALRLYLARQRIGTAAPAANEELAANAKNVAPSDPLYLVLELFQGERTAGAVLANVGTNPCETQLYVGSWYSVRGDNQKANEMLTKALETCTKADIPYYDAKIGLANLGH